MSTRFACIWICLCVAMMGSVSSVSHSLLEDHSDLFESHADRGSVVVTFDDSIHSDAVNAMDFDRDGNVIVGGLGCARDSSQLTVPYSCTMAFEGGTVTTDDFIPAFVSIIDTDGAKLSTYLFSSGFGDRVDAVLSLSNGDILVAGGFCWQSSQTNTPCALEGGGMSLLNRNPGTDAFVFRMTGEGQVVWSTALWSGGNDIINSLSEGPNGEIYVYGIFCNQVMSNCNLRDGSGTNIQSKGDTDLFVAKLDSAGTIQWVKGLGSTSDDYGMVNDFWSTSQKGVVATSDGGVIISGHVCMNQGWLDSCSFRFSPEAEPITRPDGFVAKYAANGTFSWHYQIGGTGNDYVQTTIALDEDRILVAGNHYSWNFTAGDLYIGNSGSSDAWWGILNHTSREWEGLWDSDDSHDSYIHSAAVGQNGEFVLAGSSCWDTTPCMTEINGLEFPGESYGLGWAMLVNSDGTSEWIQGVASTTRGNSHVNEVAMNDHGDIAMSLKGCESEDANNGDCMFSMLGHELGPLENASVVQILVRDIDRDGAMNPDDMCPDGETGWTSTPEEDMDSDGCRDGTEDEDDDNDGWSDYDEESCGKSSVDGSSTPTDADGDGVCDSVDTDDDDDGTDDDKDSFPLDPSEAYDHDGDGVGNNADPDDDNDDWEDDFDDFPRDGCAHLDTDGDGLPDSLLIPNCPTSLLVDEDDDGDGTSDMEDDYPLDPHLAKDTDGDGLPDYYNGPLSTFVVDDDDDGDGIPDTEDVFPLDPRESQDMDGDGVGDVSDPDRDGDGWLNQDELDCGTNPSDTSDVPEDTDGDGVCNELDTNGVLDVLGTGPALGLGLAMVVSVMALMISRYTARKGEEFELPNPPKLG